MFAKSNGVAPSVSSHPKTATCRQLANAAALGYPTGATTVRSHDVHHIPVHQLAETLDSKIILSRCQRNTPEIRS